jgi:hypothetical protein
MTETIEVWHANGGPILIDKDHLAFYQRKGYKVVEKPKPDPEPKKAKPAKGKPGA